MRLLTQHASDASTIAPAGSERPAQQDDDDSDALSVAPTEPFEPVLPGTGTEEYFIGEASDCELPLPEVLCTTSEQSFGFQHSTEQPINIESPAAPPVEQLCKSEYHIGTRIRRFIGGDTFLGTLAEIWSDGSEDTYRINYDDGDAEDLNAVEFACAAAGNTADHDLNEFETVE